MGSNFLNTFLSKSRLFTRKCEEKPAKASIWHLVKTTLAAFVGVQTDKNREQDFSQSSPLPYIIMGVVFTALFVTMLIVIATFIV